jgi:hypothetical protein
MCLVKRENIDQNSTGCKPREGGFATKHPQRFVVSALAFEVQRDIEDRGGVGKSAYGNEIHTRGRHRGGGF